MDNRLINRLLLRHASDVNGIPQTVQDFADVLATRGIAGAEDTARRSLNNLQTLGYVQRCEATAADRPMYKITADGLRQINKQVAPDKLDAMIWGAG